MRLILSFALIISTIVARGQNYTGSFTFRTILYSLKSEKLESGAFKITIEEPNARNTNFTLNPLKLETFKVAFNSKVPTLSAPSTVTTADSLELNEKAKSLFFSIIAQSLHESLSDAPIAGKLTIAESVNFWKGENKKSTTKKGKNDNSKSEAITGTVKINDIEIEFYEGFIETIKVSGDICEGKVKRAGRFENKFGIGFATRNNYKNLKFIALFDIKTEESYYIKLGDLLDYDYAVKPMTKDFSPANQVISSYGGQKLELRKEETSKLFEAIVFSDFLGLNKEKANGLLQTEVAKRINIISRRRLWKWLGMGAGFAQYIRPSVVISKIEENNRFLPLKPKDEVLKDQSGKSSLKQGTVTSPLQLYYYQNLSLGLDVNLLFLENADLKYHFYVNGGFRFGRTAVRDSLRTLSAENKVETTGLVDEYGINYFTIYPEVNIQFLPEERFSVLISDRLQGLVSAFDKPKLETLDKNSEVEKKTSKWINTIEIMAYVKTGTNGKLFARWRFNSQVGNIKENFHQLQLGYSFYILKKN